MSILYRSSKGSPLTNAEIDENFRSAYENSTFSTDVITTGNGYFGSRVFIGTSTSNAFISHGLNIDIGTDGTADYAFAIEGSDVNTGQTTLSKTTQFFGIHRRADNIGGALLRGQSGHVIGIGLEGYAGDNDTTTGTGSTAAIELQAAEQVGTTVAAMVAGIESNMAIIRDYTTPVFFFKAGGHLYARGTGAGFTVEQLTGDDIVFRARSTGDVSTGLTTATADDVADADFFTAAKMGAANGGLRLQGVAEDAVARDTSFEIVGYGGQAATTDTTSSVGLINFYAAEHDGANALRNAAVNADLFTVQSHSAGARTTRMLIKGDDGEMHLGNTTLVALDDEDDVQLVRAMQKESASSGILLTEHDNPFYNYDKLRAVGLIGPKDDNGYCLFPLQPRLAAHEGAIWQIYLSLRAVTEKLQSLENKLVLLA